MNQNKLLWLGLEMVCLCAEGAIPEEIVEPKLVSICSDIENILFWFPRMNLEVRSFQLATETEGKPQYKELLQQKTLANIHYKYLTTFLIVPKQQQNLVR